MVCPALNLTNPVLCSRQSRHVRNDTETSFSQIWLIILRSVMYMGLLFVNNLYHFFTALILKSNVC